ncbi:MAG: alginate lyase family protein [Anaerolineales bacterium]
MVTSFNQTFTRKTHDLDAFSTISLRLTAAKELGILQTSLFAFYQLGKRAGLWRLLTPVRDWVHYRGELNTRELIPVFAGEPATDETLPPTLFAHAEAILHGQATLFGAITIPLHFSPSSPLHHWTHHETPQINGQDIKFVWEPARFGWVFPLTYAYALTQDERYPAAFWKYFEQFCTANPPNLGPHWSSAQEVALRLIAFTHAYRAFTASRHSTPERRAHLGRAVAAHAARIPPTLLYARAQNNNHLLSEAAALYTAGLVLPDHPQAPRWRDLGWKWFHHGLQTQIEPDGTYSQHSTNYHRLMLQLALWVHTLAQKANQPFPALSLERLAAATRWLLAFCDPATGRVPNLGPNDGAYILPLTSLPFDDYRPVLQAASRAFLGEPAFAKGEWDELSNWLKVESSKLKPQPSTLNLQLPTLIHPALPSRAYLRAAHFHARPGHADQLHLDLWWRGLNVALDPGTYLYNADPPWDNSLTTAFVHNTVTINGLDQMTRAGRFLYLHRAQATILEHTPTRLTAEHDGYRKLGVIHRRTVEQTPTGWRITDTLMSRSPITDHQSPIAYRLHWLLPDWPWKLKDNILILESPFGPITLTITQLPHYSITKRQSPIPNLSLYRAGQTLLGFSPAHPTWGWYSPTYGVKEPALAFVGEGKLSGRMITEWVFPEEQES